VKLEVVTLLARVRIRNEDEVAELEAQERRQAQLLAEKMQFQHANPGGYSADEEAEQIRLAESAAMPKVGRNEACPCGSGKKYKHCHGQLV
ncbi:MAG: SEC-C metal-binding domain-containing protein, partial [Pseudomonadota bacterium]|nr:SEC-C metal-binding domain-containing protein [Pseudomonadota bacterium]